MCIVGSVVSISRNDCQKRTRIFRSQNACQLHTTRRSCTSGKSCYGWLGCFVIYKVHIVI